MTWYMFSCILSLFRNELESQYSICELSCGQRFILNPKNDSLENAFLKPEYPFKWQLWQHEWLLVMQSTLAVTISQFMKMKPEYTLNWNRKELATRLLHQLEFNQYTISVSDNHLSKVNALVMAWSTGLLHFRLEPRRKCSRLMAWSFIWTWDNSFLSMPFDENILWNTKIKTQMNRIKMIRFHHEVTVTYLTFL